MTPGVESDPQTVSAELTILTICKPVKQESSQPHLFDFSTVNDVDNIVDGDACLSYVGGQDLRKKQR